MEFQLTTYRNYLEFSNSNYSIDFYKTRCFLNTILWAYYDVQKRNSFLV